MVMDLSNKEDIQMTYLSFKPNSTGLTFSVDGKDFSNADFRKNIHAIVSYVSTFSHTPMIAKIEILVETIPPIIETALAVRSSERIKLISIIQNANNGMINTIHDGIGFLSLMHVLELVAIIASISNFLFFSFLFIIEFSLPEHKQVLMSSL